MMICKFADMMAAESLNAACFFANLAAGKWKTEKSVKVHFYTFSYCNDLSLLYQGTDGCKNYISGCCTAWFFMPVKICLLYFEINSTF